jgi:hypothetical protein
LLKELIMAKFEFNEQALADVANQAVAVRAKEMQELLDGLLATQQGRDVEEVKLVLESRWQTQFDRSLADPHLSVWAKQLASGGRVEVQQKDLTAQDF